MAVGGWHSQPKQTAVFSLFSNLSSQTLTLVFHRLFQIFLKLIAISITIVDVSSMARTRPVFFDVTVAKLSS